ncbi:SUMF1/EgtB/PvdO family nonheme iron enzyme [bacterium]|nr:SUMF1/EgtB/PvdO family nonheme iron enzyme [bacterium]
MSGLTDMLDMGGFSLFNVVLTLIVMRATARVPAKPLALVAGLLVFAASVYFPFAVEKWLTSDAPNIILGLPVLTIYLGWCAVFIAACKSGPGKDGDETAPMRRTAAAWLMLYWTLLMFFPKGYGNNLWILDATNVMFFGVVDQIAQKPWASAFLSAYGHVNAVIALNFVRLTTAGTLVPAYLAAVLVGAYSGKRRFVHFTHVRPPRWFPLVAVVVFAADTVARHWDDGPWRVAFTTDLAVQVVLGAYLAVGLVAVWNSARRSNTRPLAAAVVALAFVSGRALDVLTVVGVLDNLFGARRVGQPAAFELATDRMQRAMRRAVSAPMLFVTLIVAVISHPFSFPHPPVFAAVPADKPATAGMIALAEKEGRLAPFAMDRYEYPNREGQMPTGSLTYGEADALCAEAGKRLCTDEEWQAACRGPDESFYEFTNDVGELRRVVDGKCNVLPMRHGRRRAEPSGRTGLEPNSCANELGVGDMTGNLWEYVASKPGEPWRRLKGSNYNYNDDRTTACTFSMELLDTQIEMLDRASFGVRCCADLADGGGAAIWLVTPGDGR